MRLPLLMFLTTCALAQQAEAPAAKPTNAKVQIKAIAADQSEIVVASDPKNPLTISVAGNALRESLKAWKVDDGATVTYLESTTAGKVTRSLVSLSRDPPKIELRMKVKLKAIAEDRSQIVVWKIDDQAVPDKTKPLLVTVPAGAFKDALKSWRAGDLAAIAIEETVSAGAVTRTLTDLSALTARDLGLFQGWKLYAGLAVGLGLLISLKRFIVGEDNRYSNSKLQMALWFSIVVVAYLVTLFTRGFEYGAINIPQNLLLLSGLSLISFGGAKAITAAKMATPGVVPRTDAETPNAVTDLVNDAAGKPDLGDLQMLVVTILAAAVYIVQLNQFLPEIEMRAMVSLPEVDNTLLASFGLGQGAYLVKKAVGGVNQ